jgi:hypothetical protein
LIAGIGGQRLKKPPDMASSRMPPSRSWNVGGMNDGVQDDQRLFVVGQITLWALDIVATESGPALDATGQTQRD